MATQRKSMSRRTVAVLWFLLIAVTLGILIGLGQIALLYLVATVALSVLMLVVAFSDLENVGREDIEM
jgi:heme O synthase-like polyprenyltransferase